MSSYSEYERRLFANVDKHGWQCASVFDQKGNDPAFSYSTGFTKSLNAPEFIVFGLPKDLMHNMLWEVYRQVESGARPADWMRWQGLLEGFDCIARKAVHKDLYTDYAVSANWFWRETGNAGSPEVYQIVWPGARQGLFPWEKGCAEDVIKAQTPLWALG